MKSEKPRYITQLSSEWFNEVTKTVNATGEDFIKVEDRGDKKVICIDSNKFKLAVYAILQRCISATGFNYVKPQNYDLDFEYRN